VILKKRLVHIDVLRGIAILLVTGFHIWRPLGSKQILIGPNSNFNILGFLENGEIGVELFFLISGYCLALSGKNIGTAFTYKDYYWKRFFRIAPPYYMAILFWNIAIEKFGFLPKPNDAYHNIMHILFLHNLDQDTFHSVSGVFWSLAVEMQFYLILPFVLPAIRNIKSALILLFSTLIISCAINLCFPDIRVISWSVLSYSFLFVLGSFLGLHYYFFAPITKNLFISIVFAILVILMLTYVGPLSKKNELFDITVATLLGILLIINREVIDNYKNSLIVKSLSFIGVISYSVYLYNYLVYLPVPVTKNIPILSWVIPLFLVIFAGWVSFLLIENNVNKFRNRIINVKP
jgi:peptidoglycan/LPS O-acetylase OafA/YrhL